MKRILLIAVCLPLLVLNTYAQAQPADTAGQQQFDAAFAAYQQSIRQIEVLRVEYQDASEERRKAINDEIRKIIPMAQQSIRDMVSAGVELYKSDPGGDPKIEELLLSVARHYAVGQPIPNTSGDFSGGDQFELALPAINALIEGGSEDPELQVWGFVAAIMLNDYAAAEQRLATLREKKILESGPPGEDEATLGVWGTARRYSETFNELRARWEREKAIRDAEAQADNLPRVKIETSKGTIIVELFEDQAPIATANFITLVKDGFYDGVVFHRVLQGFMAQGGDPTGTGGGGPGHCIACECFEDDARQHFRGTLSMAHAGRDTGGSQFFLTFVPTDFLDGRHTAFGRVVEGMEILGEIQRVDPQGQGAKPEPDKIVKATVVRDRGHSYEFQKLPAR